MGQYNAVDQIKQAKKPAMQADVKAEQMAPVLQNAEMPQQSGMAGLGSGILGGLAQIGQEMSQPMQMMQSPDWLPNQGVMGKNPAPVFQAGNQLSGATLL